MSGLEWWRIILERQRHGLVPAEAVEDVQVPLERQRLGDVPAVADARMANERPVSPGVGGQAGDGAVAAGIGARGLWRRAWAGELGARRGVGAHKANCWRRCRAVGSRSVYTQIYAGEEPVLADHSVLGVNILPGAGVVAQALAALVAAELPGPSALTSLRFLRPIAGSGSS